ncbi:MDR family MFS transporter [Propioniciclava sinopodophylli]|uniref:MDR family MFS transporter n=1 Tax=Propioniciclava sinopodophylli TaxID=1837344 RepID=UPI00249082C4|nr:MDR family MFS transporter [Propioniciclava sinopodophylli]
MSAPARPSTEPSAVTPDQPTGNRSIIAILLVGAFIVILNETTMNVALSQIMGDFGVTERVAQWLTTAFMLTMAIVIPITGWMLERFPTRTVFTLAMGLFSLGTAIAALAPTFAVLLSGRVVQASGTAMMMPLLMTTIMQLVPPHGRGQMMGNISMVIAVAPATGPTLSGLLLQLGSWRFIFAFVLPIALAILVLGRMRLRNANEPRPVPLDGWSIPLTVLAFGPLIYGLSLIGDTTIPFWGPMLAIGVGIAGLIGFAARQFVLQAQERAFLDLRTFTHGTFTVALMMMAIGMMALFGTIIMLPLLLQRVYGLEPLQVGLMMLPGGVAMGVMGPLIGRLYDRVGPRPLVIPASLVVLAVFVGFSFLTPSTPWWLVMVGHMTMSTSFAFIFTPLFTVALGSLPKRLYSHGSALIGTIQQVAGAAGTALFVTVFAMQSEAAAAAGASEARAMLEGAHWAFLGAGAVWTAAVVAGFFLRRPPEDEDADADDSPAAFAH